jgi:hypothetical protein
MYRLLTWDLQFLKGGTISHSSPYPPDPAQEIINAWWSMGWRDLNHKVVRFPWASEIELEGPRVNSIHIFV